MKTEDFKERLYELLKGAVESADIEFYICHRRGSEPLTDEEKTKVKGMVKRKAIKMVKEYFGEFEEGEKDWLEGGDEGEKTKEPHDNEASQGES